MGVLRSFNVGITGLQAHGESMGVIGDNIANAGTNAFKSSRAEFQDILDTSLKGSGEIRFGSGVKLSNIKPLMSQGDITRTGVATDLAINGDGFFKVETPFGDAYTRDGSMKFNRDGELTSSDGYRVSGYLFNANGEKMNQLGPIKLTSSTIQAESTSKVGFRLNLDSREKIKDFSMEDPGATSNFSSFVTVYDNVGTPRGVTVYFNKTSDNVWKYRAIVDGKDAEGGEEGKMVEMASGDLIFDEKGRLQDVVEQENSFNFNNGARPNQQVNFDFGKSITEGGDGLDASTQYGTNSTISQTTANGYEAATIGSLSFDNEGTLAAVYTNGETRNIAQVAVAKFENNEGLMRTGKNLFRKSRSSGEPSLGRPNEGGRGEVLSNSVELSNVDLAKEFIGLMTSQRNFQANAKALNTADQMLQEVINIKRS